MKWKKIMEERILKLFYKKKIIDATISVAVFLSCCGMFVSADNQTEEEVTPVTGRWSEQRANEWYDSYPWLVGCNYIPSNAINQLEMWQEATFDLEINDKELKMAHDLGFNFIRVYLHDLAYEQDPKGFLKRVDQFLSLTEKYDIDVMLVFFDDCWLNEPRVGKQLDPLPGVHNSGWLESPGLTALKSYNAGDQKLKNRLETYVKAVLNRFKNDKRVAIWDLYNEHGNSPHYRQEWHGKYNKVERSPNPSEKLLHDVYVWAREINPSQPLTTCFWGAALAEKPAREWADVVSFHNYRNANHLAKEVERLQKLNRPIICTEYMGRHTGSTFQTCLPIMRKEKVAAVNWGFVAGKTNTIYPWNSWMTPGKLPEPELWFHDVFRKDGTPFDQEEIKVIKEQVRLSKISKNILIPTAEDKQTNWKYTKEKPVKGWCKSDFDDSSWKSGKAGFGGEGAPNAVIGTAWTGDNNSIWLRKEFTITKLPEDDLFLSIYYDDEVSVYLNGKEVYADNSYQTTYKEVNLNKFKKFLKKGANSLAVTCHDKGWGQYIDAGLYTSNNDYIFDSMPDEVYLFSFFQRNGQDGLHLAYSLDGLKWEALNNNKSLLKPVVGNDKLMRDPCVVIGGDGKFHMVWTISWGEKGIGIAHSEDMINWSEQSRIPVMDHEEKAANCWAPEIHYDKRKDQYLIYWSTTIPGKFKETEHKGGDRFRGKLLNHRVYYTTTKDFKTYTPTKLFLEPGFNVIDPVIVDLQPDAPTPKYAMILKDETKRPKLGKDLYVAFSDDLYSNNWKVQEKPFTPKWVEGPSLVKNGDDYVVYYDCYTKHHYGAKKTRDFKTWTDITDEIDFPKGTRHGTAFKVKKEVLLKLLKELK